VDISDTITAKIAALRKHASQLGDWDPEKMIREWAAEEGKERSLKYAEAFKVMILEEEKPEN
jgi:LmbE family N-acetylglucosaminyl deacetylase